MLDDPRLLFANDWFYTAFSDGDLPSMARLWAEQQTITCLHPGWEPLVGRDDVMASWEAILGNPDAPGISHSHNQAFITGPGQGYVLCYEKINESYLVATNVFVLEGQDWRMIHHHAAPSGPPETEEDDTEPGSMLQ